MKWFVLFIITVFVIVTFVMAALDYPFAQKIAFMLILIIGYILGAATVIITNYQHGNAEEKRFRANANENAGIVQGQLRSMQNAFSAQQQQNRALQEQLRALQQLQHVIALPATTEPEDDYADDGVWSALDE